MNKLLMNDSSIVLSPNLAVKVGLNEAIFLQQLHYWLERSKHEIDGYKWVYNTYENWQAQFPFWSISTIKRIVLGLERLNLIVTGNFNRLKADKTKWYRINYEVLESMFADEGDQVSSVKYQEESGTGCSNIHKKNEFTSFNEQEYVNPFQAADERNMSNPFVQFEQSMLTSTIDQFEPPHDLSLSASRIKMNQAIPETTSENTPEKKIVVIIDNDTHARKAKPSQFYKENGFGKMRSYIANRISYWCNQLSDELVVEAMKRAVISGVSNWRYTEAILRYWLKRNYNTIGQIEAAEKDFRERKKLKNNNFGYGSINRYSSVKQKPKYFVLDITAGERD